MTAGSCANTLYSRIPLQTSQPEDRAGGHCKAGEVSRIHLAGHIAYTTATGAIR